MPPMKHAMRVQAACFGEKPPSWSDFFADGNMLYRAEKSYARVSLHSCHDSTPGTYHHTKAQTERYGQKRITVLYPEVFLARKLSNYDVDAYYRRSDYTSCGDVSSCLVSSPEPWSLTNAAQAGHYPSSFIIRQAHNGLSRSRAAAEDSADLIRTPAAPNAVRRPLLKDAAPHRHLVAS